MAIYKILSNEIVPFKKTSFGAEGVYERQDLQRLLRTQIEVVCPDVLVISEGFREWEDSKRELDLLGLDKDANLVVIELKRTEDAGHAELQAIRYAAMVSAMTFERAVSVYEDFLQHNGEQGEGAKAGLLAFLGWEEPDEERFAQDVRIVLVSANFSKELTTSVMWLNERGLDIRCVRMAPYRDGDVVLVDIQQMIPLPEAADYMVRIREKAAKERQGKGELDGRQAFWQGLLKRASVKGDLFSNVSPSRECWIGAGGGAKGLFYTYVARQHSASVQFVLETDKDVNEARFDWLKQKSGEIEEEVNGQLQWRRCDKLKKCYLSIDFDSGYKMDQAHWAVLQDQMIDAMVSLEAAISPFVPELRKIGNTAESLGESEG